MASKYGKKSMTIEIPAELWSMYSKFCVDNGITKVGGFVMFLEYLQQQHYTQRRPLNAQSDVDIKQVIRKP